MASESFPDELTGVFPPGDPESLEGMRLLNRLLLRFSRPREVLRGIANLVRSGDPLVAPPETFLHRRYAQQFENWDYPVTVQSLVETEEGRLLSLPPGSRRFSKFRRIIPDIVNLQLQVRFPRLLAELANRPNLFFPGVFFPQELEIGNMEMISALHGTFYVVHAELKVGRPAGRGQPASVVLKPTDMALESIVTFTLQFINRRLDPATRRSLGPILAPTIVSIDDRYGIMDLIPGKNGVEFLPQGIQAGSIQELRRNEFPPDLDLSREEVLQIAREFSKQAVMAYYLRLYDRKPDQLMIHRIEDGPARAALQFAHIDFGRALKRNYALPWKRHYDPTRPPLVFDVHEIPYFEAAAAFIYLPHFIPADLKDRLSPFDGEMREVIIETFVRLAGEIKSEADEIHSLLKYLIGRRTQYRPVEVQDICVAPEDVEEVYTTLIALDDPEDIIESILNLAYHEREGTAALLADGDDESGVYRRALLSGDRVTRLTDRLDGAHPYRLRDYRTQGRVSYDVEQKKLRIHFGDQPERVIAHVERQYSARLARFIRQYPGDPRGVELEIVSDGSVTARKVSPDGRTGLRQKLRFPPDIMQEINESGSGFSPAAHVLAHAADYKMRPAADDYLLDEIDKHRRIIANDLEGREILQFMMATEPPGHPLNAAMAEMVRYLLANPDYLADKDPYESINQLVLSLARKHLQRRWPGGRAMIEEFLPKNFLEAIHPLGLPILGLYEHVDLSHFIHLILTVRLADELGRRAALAPAELKILRTAAFLHDLNVMDVHFREALMEPSGRLNRPILAQVMERHAEIAAEIFEKSLSERKISAPDGMTAEMLLHILKNHHRPSGRVEQILHLADNIAVFADRTRPDHWNRGFLRLEEIAPRWIDAQLERKLIDREVWSAAQGFFSDPKNYALLRELDRMSAFFPQVFGALQMAAALHLGLNPQHTNPMADLRERHGEDLVNRIFDNLMKSGLSVRDKIKVLNRTDAIAPMFRKETVSSFAFINAAIQPVQRMVELIVRFVTEGRTVILMGILPRVMKTYQRFRSRYAGDTAREGRRDWERVCVIAGVRRLQFITHSYPYEADFRMPFHKIIRTFRESRGVQEPCCLIPFERFMESYAPTADAETRVRQLEKASDVEELRGSDHIRAEAGRYLQWESAHPDRTFDDRAKERFRRILLSNFTNRDVLLFYDETVHGDVSFTKALREVIGALHENPNYLSDRSVYYSLQELVRSFGQIHFYGKGAADITADLGKFLKAEGLATCAGMARLLDALKPQFTFAKQNLSVSLQIAVALGRRWEKTARTKLSEDDWRAITAGILLSGTLLDDETLADYALSPEDISANRALRHLLFDARPPLWSLIRRRNDLPGALKDSDEARLRRLFDDSPVDPADAVPFLLIHTGLIFGSYCDFSKVENWKRGKIVISAEDLEFLWELLHGAFQAHGLKPPARFDESLRAFCRKPGPALLNAHAAKTHSYVRLFNALSLAAELRYGLKARGFDLFHHVRTIFGGKVADLVVEGIMTADFPLREKVKFARKLRLLAAAVQEERGLPARLMFIHTEQPLGAPPVRDIRRALRIGPAAGRAPALMVPSGDFDRTERMFSYLCARFDPQEFRDFRRQAKFLVGEDYPLLIKEKSLQKTDWFRDRIAAFRKSRNLSSRHLFVPVSELTDPGPSTAGGRDAGTWGAGGADPGGGIPAARGGDKGLFFFRTWMQLFD